MLPLPIPGLDVALNRYLVKLPGCMNLGRCTGSTCCASGDGAPGRPGAIARDRQPTVTVVVPARNESGNIEPAVDPHAA